MNLTFQTHKTQVKEIKNSLPQKGIPVTIKPVINTMDEKSIERIESKPCWIHLGTLCGLLCNRFYETDAM